MAYKSGDLKITAPVCGHDDCEGDTGCLYTGVRFWVCDSREKNYRHDDPAKPPYEKHGAYLPHSCDEWYIGGRVEIEALIVDLKKALEDMG